jgi:P22_AR N-terminal domain
MQIYPISFYDWRGIAIRADGHWWLPVRQVSDHLELKWSSQRAKINGSNLSKGTSLRGVPSAGGEQETLTLKLGHFGAWLLGISSLNVPEPKRERLIAMQDALLDALDRQLAQMFGLPGLMEAEDFARLPLQPQVYSQMEPAEVMVARDSVLRDPVAYQAAGLMRIGLPASRVAPLLGRSVYWTRGHARLCRKIGFVPLPPSQQRLLDQPSLFGEG